ncbi:Hypothetical protein A7982_01052 [Minicystis rosea]|nr:Hypothetical protein A7982_01052 [Minicystis rosea]
MFQAIYDSPWAATAFVGAASFAALALWIRRKSFLVAYFVLFTVEILADALRSGSWAPPIHPAWAGAVGIAFVVLGDFRYFLLVERFAQRSAARPGDATAPSAWAVATVLALIVPVASVPVIKLLPPRCADVRWTYLAYEVMFVALAVALRAVVLPRRLAAAPAAVRRWLLGVTTFQIVQYALWASADVLILGGADAGFALRLVPNAMYYALFLPFVAFRAPAEVDA